MANHTHSSSGGGGFRVDLDMTDFTQEISEGIKAAIHRALVRIGLECESYAKDLWHVITGRLRNSITDRRGLCRRGIHPQTHLPRRRLSGAALRESNVPTYHHSW